MKKIHTKHRSSHSPSPVLPSMAVLAVEMADDFNNILTTVMGACSLIERDESANAELRQFVELIRISAEHAAALSDILMQVGTADNNSARLTSVETSVRDKINSTAKVISDTSGGGPS